MSSIPTNHPLILFDGVCNLCNGSVQFIIERDKKAQYRFASLQSKIGQKILEENHMSKDDLSTILLIENGKVYSHSDVPLRIAKGLGGIYSILYIFKIVPKFIRDRVYSWVAANRYRWFGKEESCWLPTEELKSRFFS